MHICEYLTIIISVNTCSQKKQMIGHEFWLNDQQSHEFKRSGTLSSRSRKRIYCTEISLFFCNNFSSKQTHSFQYSFLTDTVRISSQNSLSPSYFCLARMYIKFYYSELCLTSNLSLLSFCRPYNADPIAWALRSGRDSLTLVARAPTSLRTSG